MKNIIRMKISVTLQIRQCILNCIINEPCAISSILDQYVKDKPQFWGRAFYDQSDIFDPYNKKFLTKGIIHPDRSIQDRVKTV